MKIGNLPADVGGSSSFTGLTDLPASYIGQGNKLIKVNAAGDGLEFGYLDNIITGVTGESLAPFDLCYLNSDGKFWKSCARKEATMPGFVLAGTAMTADQTGTFLRKGRVTNGTWSWTTVGGYVYTGTTPGAFNQTILS